MSRPEHDPSVHSEPHLKGEPCSPDLSEEKAARQLARERAGVDPNQEAPNTQFSTNRLCCPIARLFLSKAIGAVATAGITFGA